MSVSAPPYTWRKDYFTEERFQGSSPSTRFEGQSLILLNHLTQPAFRLHAVEFAGAKQTVDDRRSLTAVIRAEEEIIFSANGHRTQRVFSYVAVDLHLTVAAVLVQHIPLLQHVCERLRHLSVNRQRFHLFQDPVV